MRSPGGRDGCAAAAAAARGWPLGDDGRPLAACYYCCCCCLNHSGDYAAADAAADFHGFAAVVPAVGDSRLCNHPGGYSGDLDNLEKKE